MNISKHTKKFFSVAEYPGNFGATVYNRLFEMYGIDAIYMPLGIPKTEFHSISEALRFVGASGASISMPYKTACMQHCHPIGNIKNVNTLLKSPDPLDPKWLGFNTDAYGFEIAANKCIKSTPGAHIFGNGSLAETIISVLQKHETAFKKIARPGREPFYDWLINATPIGMDHIEDTIFTDQIVSNYKYFFDCVVSSTPTKAIRTAKKLGLHCVTGLDMCIAQITVQFEIYTGKKPNPEHIISILKGNGYEF